MVKLIYIGVFRYIDSENAPIVLDSAMDVSSFGYFTRGTISQHIRFAAQLCVGRTKAGVRQTLTLKDIPYVVHVWNGLNNLSTCAVTDEDYNTRVAFSLLNKVFANYQQQQQQQQQVDWENETKNNNQESPALKALLQEFQNPAEADKIIKVQGQLEEIKDIMTQNIEQVLHRGETLDSLLDKSKILDDQAKLFYKKAKKANSCCKYF